MKELIGALICIILAIVFLIISIMQFKEKGFLFNNAYIWASKIEREKMDKEPHYRQSAIVFAICSAIFFCMAVACIVPSGWLWGIIGILSIALLVYAVYTSLKEFKK